jgi:hypothetical protein
MKEIIMTSIDISIDEGTIIIVAEVLRQERGLKHMPMDAATKAINAAIKSLTEEGDNNDQGR